MTISRRSFFGSLAAGALARRTGAQTKRNLIIRSARPEDFEMTLAGFDSWLTPNESFFVRTHLYTPNVDAVQFQVKIGGLVDRPQTIALADLQKFPRAELVSVLECAGNGRSFYQPPVAGMQWQYGGVGNARWSGIRLSDVLKKAGVQPAGKHVMLNGADVPIGTMPDFVRSLPLAKAMHPDTLLAFEMNGQPLPASHGFPVRLVVPGWAGDSWVKWVTDIQVLANEYDGFFMKTAYRHPVHPVAPGAAVDPALMTPVAELPPKSLITSPVNGAAVNPGASMFRGAAWSGESPIAKVEVSSDSGRTWREAKLTGQQTNYGWRLWEASWTVPRQGSVVLMARATDRSGATQPFAEEWNPSGYLYNVVQQVRVEAGNPGDAPAPKAAAPVEYPVDVKQACIGCHGGDIIEGQRLTRAQWEREVNKMIGWGATVKPADRTSIVDFLAAHFKP